jgi:antitoxin PrlF
MKLLAKITSKGQVTIPLEIRRRLGVGTGDRLIFESGPEGVTVTPAPRKSRFARYRGIGNPGLPEGRAGIQKWFRQFRGK